MNLAIFFTQRIQFVCFVYFRQCFFLYKKALFIFSLINYSPLTYKNGEYQYPSWAHGIGWVFVAVSLGCIPVFAVISILRSDGHTFAEVIHLVCVCNCMNVVNTLRFRKNEEENDDQNTFFHFRRNKLQNYLFSHSIHLLYLLSSKTIRNSFCMLFPLKSFSEFASLTEIQKQTNKFPETTKCNQTKYTRV